MFENLRDALTPGIKVSLDEVPQGSGTVLPHAPYVVTQPSPGTFCAFRKQCPHAGRPVDAVTAEGISCPAHRSVFALDDGRPTTGPATRPLKQATVRVDGDRLIITG